MQLIKFADVGRALTAAEVDQNWADIETILNAAMTAEGGGVTIAGVGPTADGTGIEFIGSDGSVMGTVSMPNPFTPVGEWESGTDYALRHVATHDGSAYLCLAVHTSGEDFAVDLGLGRWAVLAEGVANTAENVAFTPPEGMTAETVQAAIEELQAAIPSEGGGGAAERVALVSIDLTAANGAITEAQWAEAAVVEVLMPPGSGDHRYLTVPAACRGIRRFVIDANGGTNELLLTGNGDVELPAGDACYDIFVTSADIRDVSC